MCEIGRKRHYVGGGWGKEGADRGWVGGEAWSMLGQGINRKG